MPNRKKRHLTEHDIRFLTLYAETRSVPLACAFMGKPKPTAYKLLKTEIAQEELARIGDTEKEYTPKDFIRRYQFLELVVMECLGKATDDELRLKFISQAVSIIDRQVNIHGFNKHGGALVNINASGEVKMSEAVNDLNDTISQAGKLGIDLKPILDNPEKTIQLGEYMEGRDSGK